VSCTELEPFAVVVRPRIGLGFDGPVLSLHAIDIADAVSTKREMNLFDVMRFLKSESLSAGEREGQR
jgi:hypothetical protein